ncbi:MULTISPECIES: Arc family DNA-binding protein [Giesbergeria]|uniref:Arc family DNA-binding protein n=1 Tax=Giesbergeria sinuosa TaxID=80883 RepID=A0ABV9QA07_9BURK
MKDMKQKITATPVKLPPELKDYLKHKAIDNRRSLANEITYRLQASREAEEAQHGKQA